jgi:hypothetical protein
MDTWRDSDIERRRSAMNALDASGGASATSCGLPDWPLG